ncbi:MAG: hypothetical protein WD824_08230 [Cyclobacteriaceae bacterium]
MSSIRILFSGLVLIGIFSETMAQGNPQGAQAGMDIIDHMLIKAADDALHGIPEEKYEGSPYLQETFVSGYVHFGKIKSTPVSMRYNIYSDIIEVQAQGVIYLLKPDPRVTKIEIGEQTFVPDTFRPLKKSTYFEVLEAGTLTLLAKKIVNYRKKIEISDVPAKYSRQPDQYYFKFDKEPVVKFTGFKAIIENSPNKKEELSQFVKAEKLSSKDWEDLVKFAKFYNSLFAIN